MPASPLFPPGFLPASASPEVGFPALLDPQRAQALALLTQLNETQWWSLDQLRAHQLKQLQRLIAFAVRATPHGRKNLGRFAADLTWESWRDVPIIGRRDLQKRRRFRSTEVPQHHGRAGVAQTSGSTGTPVVVERTEVAQLLWQVFTARDHLWQRRDTTLGLAAIRAASNASPPMGRSMNSWGLAASWIGPAGPSHILDVKATTDQQLAWLQGRDVGYLLLYPSSLRDLVRCSVRKGVRFEGLQAVRTFGEVVDPALRIEVREAWGVEIEDVYSTQELGYVGLQCPDHDHFHVQSEGVFVEVLREDGAPCDVGERGRLVITNLHNLAFPLIRYDIGDFGVMGPPCPCGRGLPVLERVIGRVHHTIRTDTGARIWLTIGVHELPGIAPIVQHQFVQREAGKLEVRLVASRTPSPGEETALQAFLSERMPPGVAYTVSWVDEIQRSSSGKFHDIVQHLRD